MEALVIRAVAPSDHDALFAYLNDHLSDNGSGDTAKFMPIARAESCFPGGQGDGFPGRHGHRGRQARLAPRLDRRRA